LLGPAIEEETGFEVALRVDLGLARGFCSYDEVLNTINVLFNE